MIIGIVVERLKKFFSQKNVSIQIHFFTAGTKLRDFILLSSVKTITGIKEYLALKISLFNKKPWKTFNLKSNHIKEIISK